ncbi:hypothetical protein QUF72_19545 [Desulfobacterales bacterium HSG2]|nr:hypothetical protein [Desulfobacterales bacterium HSG2]
MNQKYLRIKQNVGVKSLFLTDWLIRMLTGTTLIVFFMYAGFPEPIESAIREVLYIFSGLLSAALTAVINLFSDYLGNVRIKSFGER